MQYCLPMYIVNMLLCTCLLPKLHVVKDQFQYISFHSFMYVGDSFYYVIGEWTYPQATLRLLHEKSEGMFSYSYAPIY